MSLSLSVILQHLTAAGRREFEWKDPETHTSRHGELAINTQGQKEEGLEQLPLAGQRLQLFESTKGSC